MKTLKHFFSCMHLLSTFSNIFFLFHKIQENYNTGRPVKHAPPYNKMKISHVWMHIRADSENITAGLFGLQSCGVFSLVRCCTLSHHTYKLTHSHKCTHMQRDKQMLHISAANESLYILTGETECPSMFVQSPFVKSKNPFGKKFTTCFFFIFYKMEAISK